MNFFDFIILAIVLLFTILGFRKGFIISLATFAALLLGIWAAVHFSGRLDAVLLQYLKPSATWLPILSFSLMFLLVVGIVLLVAKGIEKVVSVIGLGLLNRIGGAILGLVKGVILVSLLIYLISIVDPKEKWFTMKDKQESFFYSRISKVFPGLIKTFGKEISLPEALK
jgi:membrane protein required for colicin V production